jgi:predicted acetyltransferase
MTLEVHAALEQDKPVVRRMLELYQHDLSPFANADLNGHGEFGYARLDHYWTEEGRWPFLARVAGKLAGFALVNTHHCLPGSEYSMAEFFVLKRYRRQGIGQKFAVQVFGQRRGVWEVRQLPGNTDALVFWRCVIGEYTGGAFREMADGYGEWQGCVQQFSNATPQRP